MNISDVLVVLTLWKRRKNLAAQLEAFWKQTHPVDIVIADNRPSGVDGITGTDIVSPHDVSDWVRIHRNAGPSCRFVPAYLDLDHEWTLFYDDDCLPEPGAVEWVLKMTGEAGQFSELGVIGRQFAECHDGRLRYKRQDVTRPQRKARIVDMCCRMHLVRTATMPKVLELRHRLLRFGVAPVDIATHDDLMLLGITDHFHRPKLLPAEPEGCKVIGKELDDGSALHRTPGFMEARNRLLFALQELKVLH